MSTLLYKSSRISSPTLIRRDIFGHNTTRTDDCSITDGYRIAYYSIYTNEHILTYRYISNAKMSPRLTRVKVMSQYFNP